jgi:hypothetical protein
LHGSEFSSHDDAVSQWFEEQDKHFCFSGISALLVRWRKCIKLKEDLFEKQ